jgi:hypothetical protein
VTIVASKPEKYDAAVS